MCVIYVLHDLRREKAVDESLHSRHGEEKNQEENVAAFSFGSTRAKNPATVSWSHTMRKTRLSRFLPSSRLHRLSSFVPQGGTTAGQVSGGYRRKREAHVAAPVKAWSCLHYRRRRNAHGVTGVSPVCSASRLSLFLPSRLSLFLPTAAGI